MVSANERRRYIVTSPPIGWAHSEWYLGKRNRRLKFFLLSQSFVSLTQNSFSWYLSRTICPKICCEVPKLRNLYLELYNRSPIWETHGQLCYQSTCKISKWCSNSKYKSRGFESSRVLAIRRLVGYWNRAQLENYMKITSQNVCLVTHILQGCLAYTLCADDWRATH